MNCFQPIKLFSIYKKWWLIHENFFAIISLITFVITLTACSVNAGKVGNAIIDLGPSTKFSEEELQQAANCVLKKFPDFEWCDLQKLWYSEEISNWWYGENNNLEIILFSNFHVDEDSENLGLSPDTDYEDWQWQLKRDSITAEWTLESWGYG